VEIVTLRLAATGRLQRHKVVAHAGSAAGEALPRRRVFIDQAWTEIDIYRRQALTAAIRGPALIEEDYTTVYVAPGWQCGPGEHGDLLARKDAT
jgi:N-methylhydantoinase A